MDVKMMMGGRVDPPRRDSSYSLSKYPDLLQKFSRQVSFVEILN